jgi:hypothetical protein
MAFWQTFFIILGSVLAGLGLSLAVIYVITKVQKKPMFPAQKRNQMAAEKASPKSTTMLSTVKTKLAEKEENSLEELLKNHKKSEGASIQVYVAKTQNQAPKSDIVQELKSNQTITTTSAEPTENKREKSLKSRGKIESVSVKAEVAKVQNQASKSDIFRELESNLAIATAPWGSKLTPFQTTFWDGGYLKNEPLLANHQEEVAQVYIDIRLANSIVWLSNEVGHRSADLDESYKQLCVKIAERLKKAITSPEDVK